jgi:hypothetical protein
MNVEGCSKEISPKKSPSAFLNYSQEKRRIVKEQHPELKNTEIYQNS